MRLWSAGGARIVVNEQYARDQRPHLAAVGVDVHELGAALARARALRAPLVYRHTYANEVSLQAVAAPDGTEIFVCAAPGDTDPDWVAEFEHGETPGPTAVTRIDHVNLVQRWQEFDEAVLFYTSVLGLEAAPAVEVAGPTGLVRSQVMRTSDGSVRLPLNLAPPVLEEAGMPQHIAFATGDIVGLARQARDRGLAMLAVPDNYYDDLVSRFDLPPEPVVELRDLSLLYDRDVEGEFVHFYTQVSATSSSRRSSAAVGTTGTAPPTLPSGWPRRGGDASGPPRSAAETGDLS